MKKFIDNTNGLKTKPLHVSDLKDYDDTSCGIGSFRPRVLQFFARIGVFIGIYSASGLLTSTLSVYINSQASMLERQFGFSSYDTGILMSCNDIGYLCTVIFMGYIARKVHIPRGLGFSTLLFGICGILCALPYFMQDPSSYTLDLAQRDQNGTKASFMGQRIQLCIPGQNGSAMNFHDTDGCFATASATSRATKMEQLSIKRVAFALIAIGMIFQGIGKSNRYPFTTLYVDDNVNRRKTGFYMGILTGTGIFGPALAYALGGVFNKIYVNLQDVDIQPKDPRWIGAWWLGFLVFGGASLVTAFPLFCFPRYLKIKAREANQWAPKLQKSTGMTVLNQIKDFLKSVWRVVRNPVFTLITLASCIHLCGISGLISFMPKYIANQYSIPQWQGNIILAVSNILAVSLGSFFGGLITRKFKMTPTFNIRLIISFYVFNLACFSSGFFLGCEQPEVFGKNEGSMSPHFTPHGMNCTGSCGCNDDDYFPICGSDGRSYYSPCHAGCEVKASVMTFSNCSCIEGVTATAGLCDQSCKMLYPWAAMNFIGSIVLALQIVPTFIVKIRCVEPTDRSVSVALSGFATSTLEYTAWPYFRCAPLKRLLAQLGYFHFLDFRGWMPGPVILGAVIDGSCNVWKYICGERQSCLLNDIVYFRNSMYIFGSITRTSAISILLVVLWLVKDLKAWKFEEDKNKAVLANDMMININEEEKVKLQEDVEPVGQRT